MDREATPCRNYALSKMMGHVVRAEEGNENVSQVGWHQRKPRPGGRGERVGFKRTSGPWQPESGGYNMYPTELRREATKSALQHRPCARRVPEVSLFANLCTKRKSRPLVGDIADGDE